MTLKEKDKAPAFKAKDQNEITHTLSQYKGKKVVLYFYPKDNTETCTKQACNLRDNYEQLTEKGIVVLGVSPDDEKSHKKFETKFNLPFTLLVDTEQKMMHDYGVWALKKFMGKEYMGVLRTTFLINEQGKIDHIIEKVDSKNHSQQILDLWKL
jgi:thioredoxin-dependent peroxiredoxin